MAEVTLHVLSDEAIKEAAAAHVEAILDTAHVRVRVPLVPDLEDAFDEAQFEYMDTLDRRCGCCPVNLLDLLGERYDLERIFDLVAKTLWPRDELTEVAA